MEIRNRELALAAMNPTPPAVPFEAVLDQPSVDPSDLSDNSYSLSTSATGGDGSTLSDYGGSHARECCDLGPAQSGSAASPGRGRSQGVRSNRATAMVSGNVHDHQQLMGDGPHHEDLAMPPDVNSHDECALRGEIKAERATDTDGEKKPWRPRCQTSPRRPASPRPEVKRSKRDEK